MGWRVVRLHEVMSQFTEYLTELEARPYKKLSVKLYGKGAVLDKPADGGSVRMKRHQLAQRGQVIVSEIWAKKGAIGIVPPEGDGALCTSHFFLFDLDATKIEEGWFRYLTVANFFERELNPAARGTTGYASVRPARFLECEIPLPSLDEQRRIVEKLDRIAALVDERRNAIEAAERETQALLLKAFQRAIDGAPQRPMAEVAPLVRRPVEIDLDASYPELGVRSFGRGTFHKPELPGVEVGDKQLFRICAGDLVFNIVFAWEGAVAVAQPEDDGRVGSHRFLTCVPAPETATVQFLRFYFSTPEGLQKLGEASPGGAGRNRTLGLKKLESLHVPVPPIGRQHWFDRLQAKAHEARTIRAKTAQDVEALIPAMLHEIFNGVPVAA